MGKRLKTQEVQILDLTAERVTHEKTIFVTAPLRCSY